MDALREGFFVCIHSQQNSSQNKFMVFWFFSDKMNIFRLFHKNQSSSDILKVLKVENILKITVNAAKKITRK
jgi:hypothetical protein